MNTYILPWVGDTPPAAVCAQAMRERRPFIIGCVVKTPMQPGDMVAFSGHNEIYGVIRLASPHECGRLLPGTASLAVLKEPPLESHSSCEIEVGVGAAA